MSGLHMVRLQPDMARAMAWGARQRLLKPGGDDGYVWHALLVAVFGELAPKPFRLVEPPGGGTPYLVGYAQEGEEGLRRQAAERQKAPDCDPAIAAALGLPDLAVKAMPVAFEPGRRLGFELRLRPVVRQDRDGDRKRVREVDVFVQQARARPQDALSRAAVYREWLAAQLAKGGAALETVRIHWLRRAAITRRSGTPRLIDVHGRKGGGPDACFIGELTVADPAAFAGLVARGVGRHRAFGFGMLLLKPPG